MLLHELPEDNPLRNQPLVGFFYRWKHGAVWLEIKPTFNIAKVTYNQLGPAWTDNDVFSKENKNGNTIRAG